MYLLICFRFKNRKVELKQKIMLASFLMVLVQLPLRKIAAPPPPSLLGRGAGQLSGYLFLMIVATM